MKIITWNINRFDGVYDWFSNKKDLSIEQREECAKKISEKLSEMIISPDDIAILQEVPYCDYECENDEWNKIWKELFDCFKVMFWFDSEPKKNDFNYKSRNVTIAVARKDSNWVIRPFELRRIGFGKTDGYWDYANRYIELENEELSILGVHLSFGKNGDEQWEKIHLAAKNSDFSFIVGDFNVNDLLYSSQNALKQMETNYNRLISKDIITQNQTLTSIDNIFIKKELDYNARVEVYDYCYIPKTDREYGRNIRCSDHNACICEI